jgi:hypothetical protein
MESSLITSCKANKSMELSAEATEAIMATIDIEGLKADIGLLAATEDDSEDDVGDDGGDDEDSDEDVESDDEGDDGDDEGDGSGSGGIPKDDFEGDAISEGTSYDIQNTAYSEEEGDEDCEEDGISGNEGDAGDGNGPFDQYRNGAFEEDSIPEADTNSEGSRDGGSGGIPDDDNTVFSEDSIPDDGSYPDIQHMELFGDDAYGSSDEHGIFEEGVIEESGNGAHEQYGNGVFEQGNIPDGAPEEYNILDGNVEEDVEQGGNGALEQYGNGVFEQGGIPDGAPEEYNILDGNVEEDIEQGGNGAFEQYGNGNVAGHERKQDTSSAPSPLLSPLSSDELDRRTGRRRSNRVKQPKKLGNSRRENYRSSWIPDPPSTNSWWRPLFFV